MESPATTRQTAQERQALLRLHGVTVRYPDYCVLDSLTLELPLGSTTAIMGPSGCGKTTLLRCAAGLLQPNSGSVELLGVDLARAPDRELTQLRGQMGFVFQHGALWQNMTVRENLLLPLEVHRHELTPAQRRRTVERAAERFDLTSLLHLRPAQLSGGGQKLVAYLRATVLHPRVLFLDEPTTFIDAQAAEVLRADLRRRVASGCTLVAVTHDAELTALMADRLVVLDRGRVLVNDLTEHVIHSGQPRVREILRDVLGEAAVYDQDILSLLDAGLATGGEPPEQNYAGHDHD